MNDAVLMDISSINLNSQYRLIYQYNGDQTLSAEMRFTGEELMESFAYMQKLMTANDASFHVVRSDFLIPVIEVWGLMKTGQTPSVWFPKYIKKMVKKALNGNAEQAEDLRLILCTYLAIHCEDFTRTNTMIVKDMQPNHAEINQITKISQEEFNSQPIAKRRTYEDVVRSAEALGVIKLEFPDIAPLSQVSAFSHARSVN